MLFFLIRLSFCLQGRSFLVSLPPLMENGPHDEATFLEEGGDDEDIPSAISPSEEVEEDEDDEEPARKKQKRRSTTLLLLRPLQGMRLQNWRRMACRLRVPSTWVTGMSPWLRLLSALRRRPSSPGCPPFPWEATMASESPG